MNHDPSLSKRLIVAAAIVPLVCLFVILGGWILAVFASLTFTLAGWEYWRIFRVGDYEPSLFLTAVGILAAIWMRFFFGFQYMDLWLAVVIMLSMAAAVFQQARGAPNAAFNFGITLSGMLYIGWLGSYAISLRALPQGLFWTLLVIFAAAMSDAGGYLFGSLFGKHKIAPLLTPKKSWEGYAGGVAVAGLSTWLAALGIHHFIAAVDPIHGLILGIVLAFLVPLGDFAESMLKRLFDIKETSRILPGHGGILDRIDSTLWALPIGFYLLLFLK